VDVPAGHPDTRDDRRHLEQDLQPTMDSMVDMMRNGRLKVFWVACTNPAVTLRI